MALDFPSSPTNGQAYGAYIYDSSLPGWRSKGGAVAATYVSDTAPSGAVKGDMWYRSSDGTTYVYYVDADTSQWVEIRSEISTSQVGLTPIVPTSVTVGSGTASVASNGVITFSGVSSLSFNSVFTSDYNAYRVVFYDTYCATGNAEIRLRLRSGTTDTAVEYYAAGYVAFLGGTLQFAQVRSGTFIPGATLDAGDYGTGIFEILRPHLAVKTGITSRGTGYYSNNPYGMQMDGFQNYSTAYNGVTFYPGSSTLSGVAQIYGYK